MANNTDTPQEERTDVFTELGYGLPVDKEQKAPMFPKNKQPKSRALTGGRHVSETMRGEYKQDKDEPYNPSEEERARVEAMIGEAKLQAKEVGARAMPPASSVVPINEGDPVPRIGSAEEPGYIHALED